ncbi:hypothetical protein [Psychrobacillus sp. FSL K6-2365]|uniref:hypothetical protein n=1 Tax=Psychrobacillus TaxID=1221880 RepID=UPI0030FA1709
MEIKEWSELEGTLTKEKQIYDIGGDCLLNTALVTVIHDQKGKVFSFLRNIKKNWNKFIRNFLLLLVKKLLED